MKYLAVLFLASCATTGPGPSMGCIDPMDIDCPDPTAYRSLRAQLPRSAPGMTPPPRWFVPPDDKPPPPKTPDQEAAERLLQKLGK